MVYSYIVQFDSGFAPNPFHGLCTLATCKVILRNAAQVGDWIVGTGSSAQNMNRGGYLVYAMKVDSFLTFEEYHSKPEFEIKKPNIYGSRMFQCGDNIYFRDCKGNWGQLDSLHSLANGEPNYDHVRRDTKTNRVLVSSTFYYFGGQGPKLPTNLQALVFQGRSYKKLEDESLQQELITWLLNNYGEGGYLGRPTDWCIARGEIKN
jgi:hypothetical protein